MAVSSASVKRRESISQWFKQLLVGQEQQGTAKAAAAAWLGTIYGLRAASRMDGNKEWGRVGDDMIGCLEQAYVEHMGKDGAQQIELGRKLLRTDERPEMPKPVTVPKAAVKIARPVMPKLPHMPHMPHIKTAMERAGSRRGAATKAKAKAVVAPKAKPKAKAKAKAKGRR